MRKESLAGRIAEKSVFEGGSVDDEEIVEGEAHFEGRGIFVEERGVEHRGIVGGKSDGNAAAEKFGKWVMGEFGVSGA